MLFLNLLFLSLSAVSAKPRWDWPERDFSIEQYVTDSFNSCVYNLTEWKWSLIPFGIDYNRTYYTNQISSNLEEVKKALSAHPELTQAEQVNMAKKEFPELKDEIDQHFGLQVKFFNVYATMVGLQISHKIALLKQETIETIGLSKHEAIYLLDHYYWRLAKAATELHNETDKTVKKLFTLLDGSKLLRLRYDSEYLQKHTVEWITKCQQESDQLSQIDGVTASFDGEETSESWK